MLRSNLRLHLIYILALLAVGMPVFHGTRAFAADTPTMKIAVVNPGRLLNEYKYTVMTEEKINKEKDDILTQLASWDQHKYLPEADQVSLGLIAVKESSKQELTAADKASKQKLEDTATRLIDEFLGLQTRQNPSPAELDRLKELNRLSNETAARIKDRQDKGLAQLQKEENDLRVKIEKDVRDEISKVSKAKGFTQVFSSEVLLYCDTDITDEVLKDLNDKVK